MTAIPARSAAPSAWEAVVIGAGMAGLSAAHALTERGLRPLVLEASAEVGGLVTGGILAGHEVDLGAEAFALRRPEVRRLAESLGLRVQSPAHRSWVHASGRTTPLPEGAILGIPADLTAPEVRAALSPAGLARAERDARLGPEPGARASTLAELVETRMGGEVLDRLVRPIAGGIHAADPAELAVDTVIPGLRDGLAEHGSLAAAVAAIRAGSPPGAAVATTAGGLFRLPRALASAIGAAGGEVRTGAKAHSVAPTRAGWRVATELGELHTPRVVLAVDGRAALDLLAPLCPGALPELPAGAAVTHVTLAVRARGLDDAPRGSGLLVAPGAAVRARALTHASAKWPWLAAATAPGEHVLRVSYPGSRAEPAEAVADAERLLGARIEEVREAVVIPRAGVLAPTTPAHRAAVARLQDEVRAHAGLAVTGAWVAGTGLAAVVPHGRAVAAGLR